MPLTFDMQAEHGALISYCITNHLGSRLSQKLGCKLYIHARISISIKVPRREFSALKLSRCPIALQPNLMNHLHIDGDFSPHQCFPLTKRMGVREGILPFLEGGFPPQKKVSENEDSSSIACPHNLFCWPPTSQIESTVATIDDSSS